MGMTLKRVPLDFDYPLNKVWFGYRFIYCNGNIDYCESCKAFARIKDIPLRDDGCPNFNEYFAFAPPTGEGYQLWETISEGSPVSPVYKTLDELCDWVANAPAFNIYGTKEQWKQMIEDDLVYLQMGGLTVL